MQADPLQQLRDIHVPAEPSWWPPAPGWWLVAGLCLAAALWLARRWQARRQRHAPLRQAQALYEELHANYLAGNIDDARYVHNTNALLKRLLIHTQAQQEAGAASDDAWLRLLDDVIDGDDFTQGPGSVLGNSRFARTVTLDVDSFDPLIRRFIAGLST